MYRRPLLFLFAWLLAGTARADFLLVAEPFTVFPGGRIEVSLIVPNDTQEQRTFEIPQRLTLRPSGEADGPLTVLEAVEPGQTSVTLAPGSFHRARYAGRLADDRAGRIVLEPVDFKATLLVLEAIAAETAAPPLSTPPVENAAPTAAGKTAAAPTDPDAARFAAAFSPYEPNYFAVGSNGLTNARFQVSFKFRFFNPNTKTPFLEKLYLAYSQTSFWDLEASSKPFLDSSYRPSIFFLDDAIRQWPYAGSRLGFQAGLEHESNGKDDTSSRSINIAYVRPTLTFPLGGNHFIALSPKIYGYLDKSDNPDIDDYRGYTDFLVKIGETDGFQLASTFRKGTRSGAYSGLLDASYPLRKPSFGNLGGYLHLQYFAGYGESLIDYNVKLQPQFRIGLMITR